MHCYVQASDYTDPITGWLTILMDLQGKYLDSKLYIFHLRMILKRVIRMSSLNINIKCILLDNIRRIYSKTSCLRDISPLFWDLQLE